MPYITCLKWEGTLIQNGVFGFFSQRTAAAELNLTEQLPDHASIAQEQG